ncbi:MAG: cell division protein FtsK [Pseudonocardiales bacterium]|nr:cell division protein FtsK [Pseudonocardiales bacterium]
MTIRMVHRPARTIRALPPVEPMLLAAPPVLPDAKTGGPPMQALLPMVGAMSSMTMMITLRRSPIMVAVGALVLVAAALGGLVMAFGQRGQANRTRKLHRERYLDYLEKLSDELSEAEFQSRANALLADPDPSALPGLIRDPARLWERRRAHSDFLRLRLGTGTMAWREITVPDDGNPTHPSDEFMLAEANALAARYRVTPGLPLTVALDRAGDVAIVGPSEQAAAVVRALLVQLAVLHAPEDAALALACPPERIEEWNWLGWLPHLIDEDVRDGPIGARRIATGMGELGALLSRELSQRARSAAEARRGFAQASEALSQRLVVVSDARDGVAAMLPLPDVTLNPSEAGITVLHLVSDRLHEPGNISLRITVDDSGSVMVEDLRAGDHLQVAAGTIDQVSSSAAEGIARDLAGRRLSLASLAEQAQIGAVDTATLLGIDDVLHFDPLTQWRPRSERDFLRIPIGVDDNGGQVLLDLKESASLGMGPHGLCVGATGSGKSELLRTLVTSLAATHPPDQVAMVLVDYKGGAAFAPFANLPHVAGLVDNLADDPGLVERAHASLNGEVVRRQRVLKDAGNVANIGDYNALRMSRPELDPLPHLLIVIDEFGELVTAEESFIDLFLTIGRIGRSIGVHLLLSSQRIEGGRLRGLDTYLSYRIGLRTFSEAESSIVLDTPDAYHLPPLPGYGWLKVDTSIYSRFRAAYVSGAAVRQIEIAPDARGAGLTALRLPPYPGILAANQIDSTDDAEPVMPERAVTLTLLDAMLERIAAAPVEAARTVWLPPLPKRTTLDRIGGPASVVAGRGLTLPLRGAPMQVPMGIVDDPARQDQQPWFVDLTESGGHIALVGGPQTGKTTWLRTLVAGLALTHTPEQVAIYGLDLAGGGLASLREFPHVGGIASRTDGDRLRRTAEELLGMLAHREEVFRERSIDSLEEMRVAHAAGQLPELPSADIVLIIDAIASIKNGDHDYLDDPVSDLLQRGPSYGIHVVASMLRFNDIRMTLQPAFGTRMELRLTDSADSIIDRKLSATLRSAAAGRVLTDSKLFAQTALPRTDGQTDTATAARALVDLGKAVAAAWPGRRVPGVRVLPAIIEESTLPDAIDEPTRIPIGVTEATLGPVLLDLFKRDQHLLVLGDSESGRTTLLRGIARGLVERYKSDEIVLAVFDPRLGLAGVVPDDYLGGFAGNSKLAGGLSAAICQELDNRMPDRITDPAVLAAGNWWQGPQIVLIVDDYDVLTAAGQTPLAAFVPYLPSARDIGLHVVLARPVAGASRGMWDGVFSLVRDTGAAGVILSGDRTEGQLLGGVYATPQPPGRGTFVRRGERAHRVQLARFADTPENS